jgi:hypothetical protein
MAIYVEGEISFLYFILTNRVYKYSLYLIYNFQTQLHLMFHLIFFNFILVVFIITRISFNIFSFIKYQKLPKVIFK